MKLLKLRPVELAPIWQSPDFRECSGVGMNPLRCGDWTCPGCQEVPTLFMVFLWVSICSLAAQVNFARRQECRRCELAAPGAGARAAGPAGDRGVAALQGVKPGDWVCGQCKQVTPAHLHPLHLLPGELREAAGVQALRDRGAGGVAGDQGGGGARRRRGPRQVGGPCLAGSVACTRDVQSA